MQARQMPTEAPCALETEAIKDEINAFLAVMGTKLSHYMPVNQERMIEHWRNHVHTKAADEAAREQE